MGMVILIIAAVIEIIFGIYCCITKSSQKKIRSIVRIGVFTVFFILTWVSVIQWSFRWKLLALILFILAVIGVASLIWKMEGEPKHGVMRIAVKGIAMWLLVLVAVTPALVFPQYKLPRITGMHNIKTATYTFKDDNRVDPFSKTGEKKENTVEFWYPEGAACKYPLIVFSHGAFGTRASNTSTFRDLASNGYVVCSIDYPHYSLFSIDADKKITTIDKSFVQEVNGANNDSYDDGTKYKLEQKWLKGRTDDTNFVLDTIISKVKNGSTDKVYGLIDTGKIGLIGHSLGGATGAQLGRERSDINAVINLDGDLLGEYTGISNGKPEVNHKIYPIPILSIYSDDMKRLFEKITDPSIIIPQKLISATAPESYEVYFAGTNHMSLTDLPLVSPFLTKLLCNTAKNKIGIQQADKYYIIEKMNNLILQFFNCYLKNEGSFRSFYSSYK